MFDRPVLQDVHGRFPFTGTPFHPGQLHHQGGGRCTGQGFAIGPGRSLRLVPGHGEGTFQYMGARMIPQVFLQGLQHPLGLDEIPLLDQDMSPLQPGLDMTGFHFQGPGKLVFHAITVIGAVTHQRQPVVSLSVLRHNIHQGREFRPRTGPVLEGQIGLADHGQQAGVAAMMLAQWQQQGQRAFRLALA